MKEGIKVESSRLMQRRRRSLKSGVETERTQVQLEVGYWLVLASGLLAGNSPTTF